MMIKTTKVTTKFCRNNKINKIKLFISEYKKVTKFFVDYLWDLEKIPALLNKDITSNVKTWLSARAVQAAGKQASAIVKGVRSKQNRRLWQINKFKSQGMFKRARKLQIIFDKNKISKPTILNVEPELDSRFVKFNLQNKTTFDGWIILSSLGVGLNIKIPFKKTKHFNKMLLVGSLRASVKLSVSNITLAFEIDEPPKAKVGVILGIDIGQSSTISCSNGQVISEDNHGHTYKSICQKLARKKRESKGFRRAERHRTNYINWSVNKLNLSGVKEVRRENIRNMRIGKRTNRTLFHWNYRELFDKLDSRLNDVGVQVVKISPTYTSQRCSNCGWVRKGNRKSKLFKCSSCGFEYDADLNAAKNISLCLPAISKEKRLEKSNRTGFYWLPLGQEPIVSVTQKINLDEVKL